MVPNDLLVQFFKGHGHGEVARVCKATGERDIDPIIQSLSLLPAPEFDRVERELHWVFDLSCETGITAIREAAELFGNGSANFPEDVGLHHLAMWTWLEHPEVVRQAIRIHQVDHLAWWRKRTDLPRREPNKSKSALRRLAGVLSELLISTQGRGRVCTVETLCRNGTESIPFGTIVAMVVRTSKEGAWSRSGSDEAMVDGLCPPR
jgi:hypothetical protein